MQMQYLGQTLTPWWINSEVGTLANDMPPDGNLFRYLRYDVRLELPWIEEHMGAEVKAAFGRELTELDVIRMRSMDDPTIVEGIYTLAKIAAEKQVKAEHWIGDVPSWCDGNAQSAAAARKEASRQARVPAPPSLWVRSSKAISVALSKLRAALVRMRNPDRS
jgi:hypothetical protein